MTHASNLFRGLAACLLMVAIAGCQPAQKKTPDAETPAEAGKSAEASKPAEAAPTEEAKPAETEPAPAPATTDTPAPAPPEEKPAEEKPESEKTAADEKPAKVMLGTAELFAGIPGEGKLTTEQIQAWLDDPQNHEPLDFELPLGMSAGRLQVKGVDKNPLTRAKIELGRQLYFDPRLSSDFSISCAGCHDPDEGFAKHTQFGVGIKSQTGGRNSPISYNRILSDAQFWDGRAGSLEEQAVGPIANPIEMGNTHDACVTCLDGIPGYNMQFKKIFGKLDIETVGQALASFERAVVTGPSPYDYYEVLRPFERLDKEDIDADPELKAKYEKALADAEAHPMSESAKRGRELYFTDKANCSACHVGPNLTDEKYHNIGVGMDKEKPDIGREEVTKDPKDHGAFKTPTVRNVAHSGPYMHDGSQKTLAEVVEWYAKGGHANPSLSDKIKKLDLTDQDKADLVEFMMSCTGDFPKINRERLPE
jgi:cytochrome c peroxidase